MCSKCRKALSTGNSLLSSFTCFCFFVSLLYSAIGFRESCIKFQKNEDFTSSFEDLNPLILNFCLQSLNKSKPSLVLQEKLYSAQLQFFRGLYQDLDEDEADVTQDTHVEEVMRRMLTLFLKSS